MRHYTRQVTTHTFELTEEEARGITEYLIAQKRFPMNEETGNFLNLLSSRNDRR